MSADIISPKDLRSGHTIIWNDFPCLVLDHWFNKTAMRGGIVKCKIKNLITKDITIEDLSNKKIKKALIEKVDLSFSYLTNTHLIFVNNNSYEEVILDKNKYLWESSFLEDGVVLKASIYKGEIIDLNIPDVISLKIKEITDESSEFNKAITYSGLTLNVPKFLKEDEVIVISTIDGKYKSR